MLRVMMCRWKDAWHDMGGVDRPVSGLNGKVGDALGKMMDGWLDE